MIDPLVAIAGRRPDAVALSDASRSWSWAQLLADANHLARRLRARTGERIALLSVDTGVAVVAIHGVRLAGATLVPLNRRWTLEELGPLLGRSGVSCLVHDATHASRAGELAAIRPGLRLIALDGPDALVDQFEDVPLEAPLDQAAMGALVFTSGTTGSPRGVCLTHDNLLSSARSWNSALGAREDDHWLAALPLSHVAGLGVVLRSVVAGARMAVHERFDAAEIHGALANDDVTHISLVPTQLSRVLDVGPVVATRLRAVLLGGAPFGPSLVRRALAAGLPVVTTYGLTEAASGVTALPAAESAEHPDSSGRALPGIRIRILLEDGAEAPTGITGGISVTGPCVFRGYDGDPDATEAVLQDGWLQTGDLGRLDAEGRLTITGRRDELIISGGENISPGEVEAVLLSHPDIEDAAVISCPDPIWGAVPIAAIVLRPGATDVAPDDVRSFCRAQLAGYKVPHSVVRVGAIPRTASGKIIRRDVGRLLDSVVSDLFVDRPDGARVHVRRRGRGPVLVLLHATLSNARELDPLALELSEAHTVLAIDRRSAGDSVMPTEDVLGPIDVQVHIDDITAVLHKLAPAERVVVVGHSYGGCVGLELAARHPERVASAFLFEPPYLPVLPDDAPDPAVFGERITDIAHHDGLGAAALAFLETVNGPGITRRLPATVLAQFEREGRGAVADAALTGFRPAGLGNVRARVSIGIGGRSRGPYTAVAAGLRERVHGLETHIFPTLGHGGPISQPSVVAPVILASLRSIDQPAPPSGAPSAPASGGRS